MGNIVILDENTINKIAAGEVIERPASVIKELVENSIDAGAGMISVEIRNGGISYIKVTDNGSGIREDDAVIAFERHATSKIRKADDIENLSSMGFRGEALASIAAVSSVQLVTRVPSSNTGTMVEVKGGTLINVKPTGCPAGTSIIVRDLFFNTPARFKFLKKDTTEAGYISEIISRIALGNPHVSFKLTSGGTVLLHTPGNNDLRSVVFSIYGKEASREIYNVEYSDPKIKIEGFVGKPEIARSNRNNQSFYINRRYIRSKMISAAIDEAYTTFLMKNKYAFAVLNLTLNPQFVDINVHPSKMEVKFSSEQDVFRAVCNAVTGVLMTQTGIREASPFKRYENPFKMDGIDARPAKSEQLKLNYASISGLGTMKDGNIFIKESTASGYDIEGSNEDCKKDGKEDGKEDRKEDLKEDLKDDQKEDHKEDQKDDDRILQTASSNASYGNKSETGVAGEVSQLGNCRYVGQLFSTYILLQEGENLLIIDQHAAHERIRYEELKKHFNEHGSISQQLLCTLSIELTHRELEFLEKEADFFNRLGFLYESFGGNAVILRAVPFGTPSPEIRGVFLEILDMAMKSGRTDKSQVCDDALYTMACKSAVKANMRLEEAEIGRLIQDLSGLENPYTCPHGRPSVIRLKKYDLEKMFKRIV